MKRIDTKIPGVVLLQSPVHRDERGYFQELYNEHALREVEIAVEWKQDNLSVSAKNVLRGLHYQLIRPQTKLVQVVHGAVIDVAVDIRKSSPTFGQYVSVELKAGDGQAFFIPAGFAHGFAALEKETVFLYKVSDFYSPEGDRTILWKDSTIGIQWPIDEKDALLSPKDVVGKLFEVAEVFP
jgi:dTDP-4-dehydrorhamnose 3,5-epimerase